MHLDETLKTFIAECSDLLQSMEEALLRIEQAPDDEDTINAIFRAAHTIKGNAGLFGFEGIVAFTHVAESVLDRVRSNELSVTSEMIALLLQSGDHMRALVEHVAASGDDGGLTPAEQRQGEALLEQLNDYLADRQAGGGGCRRGAAAASGCAAPQRAWWR